METGNSLTLKRKKQIYEGHLGMILVGLPASHVV